MRKLWLRKACVYRSEPGPYRLHGKLEDLNYECRDDECDKRRRKAMAHTRPENQNRESKARYQHCVVGKSAARSIRAPLRDKFRGNCVHSESEQVSYLTRENDDRNSASESCDYRMWDELDRAAKAR